MLMQSARGEAFNRNLKTSDQIELRKWSGNNRINAGRWMFRVCMADKVYRMNNWMQVTIDKRAITNFNGLLKAVIVEPRAHKI